MRHRTGDPIGRAWTPPIGQDGGKLGREAQGAAAASSGPARTRGIF